MRVAHNKANLIGQKFNKLTVVKESGRNKHQRVVWECVCECGKFTTVETAKLKNNLIKSCGCLNNIARSINGKKRLINLEGKKFNKLLVLNRVENSIHGVQYKVVCDCGNTKIMLAHSIKNDISCGCYRKESVKNGYLASHKKQLERLNGQNPFIKSKIYDIKNKCKRGNKIIPFELTYEKCFELLTAPCYYCGVVGSSIAIKNKYLKNQGRPENVIPINGIDRVDNDKGYITGNVVTCCGKCNEMKMDSNINDFKEHIKKIYDHWAKKEDING